MSEIIRVGLFGVTGVLLALQIRSQKPEYGQCIGVALAVLIFGFAVGQAGAVVEQVRMLQQYLGESKGYLASLLRIIGITYICEFSASICKDAGYGAVADQIEILGKLSVMIAGVPILFAVIEQIQGLT